ncbi:MAG: hypothetical protein FE041_04660 [Thermoplasmata archaeon]|nr:MAG: hypothetical protein FE041_04660 [Thermoplasmata archaeon]
MIGLLTSNFSLYHDLVNLLKKRNIPFVSLSFDEEIPPYVNVIITSEEEKHKVDFDKIVACDIDWNAEDAIDKALFFSHCKNPKLIFGIDPGKKIGVAVYGQDTLIRRFATNSPDEAVSFIKSFTHNMEACDVVVRIGNGARLIRNRIINLLHGENFRIEIVDESALPPHDDDAIAASSIAMAEGREIKGKMELEPKEGEIKEMQRFSRIKSKNITISKELAKRVLIGKMELEEAIEMQRKKNQA